MSIISQEYAHFLNKQDTIALRDMLLKEIGNLKDTAGKCDLSRKTLYDWNTQTKEIKLESKEKILEAAMEERPLITLELLCKVMIDRVRKLLMLHLNTIFEKLIDHDVESATFQYQKFKKEYAHFIFDKYRHELNDMDEKLIDYLKSIGKNADVSSINLYELKELEAIILEVLSNDFNHNIKKIAIDHYLPLEFLDSINVRKSQEREELLSLLDWRSKSGMFQTINNSLMEKETWKSLAPIARVNEEDSVAEYKSLKNNITISITPRKKETGSITENEIIVVDPLPAR